jgi:hypothetical protein
MPTRRELAQETRRHIAENPAKHLTGRVIIVGDINEKLIRGDQFDHRASTTVVAELTLRGKFATAVRAFKQRNSREGTPAYTYFDFEKRSLEVNKKRFKQRKDVFILDKDGRRAEPIKSWISN